MPIWKTSVLTPLASKHINKERVQKRAPNSKYMQDIGNSRGGKNAKIHAVVDALETQSDSFFL